VSVPIESILQAALRGLSLRQRVTADNIANADTPGYKARIVSFEQELRSAMRQATDGDALLNAATPEIYETTNRTGRADGNSVDLDQELLTMTETSLRYNAVAQAVASRLALYRAILTDGRGG
jgi:flagellar basal-body rod protein FlgB